MTTAPRPGGAARRTAAPDAPPVLTVRVRAAGLGPPLRLGLDAVALRSGIHPDLVRRFVALGLVEATRDATGRLWFAPSAPAALARIQRLRAALPLNYASLGLVVDLLDRISELEDALRRSDAGSRSDESWI
ncbi:MULTISPECIES: chaperone modulator CbpM [unclassified Streptomyces]|uniref:chaperone modulator CbpM n=1 Tax=unclassified Streptomyces TaxID=2593676 RepID=UPI0011CE9E32|nr:MULTISPECIES: chaperone modulator CbpM [unclassified Streptomyces]TXS68650.1 MerR family transcriptional regulator [Streptomyces sp. me109]